MNATSARHADAVNAMNATDAMNVTNAMNAMNVTNATDVTNATNALAPALAPPPSALPWLPLDLIDRIALRDGRAVVLRPVLPQDGDAEQDFVRALSLQSRYRRFHAGIPALPPSLLQRMIGVDQRSHVAVVAQPADADGERPSIVADARYVRDGDGDGAEFALAVADAWHGVGLGSRLLLTLARHGARRGVRTLRGDVLADNAPMINLVESLGGTISALRGERGVLRATFTLHGGGAPGIAATSLR